MSGHDSNTTFERAIHPMKQFSPMTVIEEGIRIDESDKQPENARFRIREMCESDSNVIVESDRHLVKQSSPSRFTDEGIQSDESDEQPEKAAFPIDET
jgi:hypothetical protein